ncbi:MAG: TetR/AcrR family transcriptional regulator [Intestinibacter sp.]|uniref:TetR/AcrR family transcriptional regulator n=1 Tax=Intestinibacter sp. TaxID=1965304 RepID=UPI002A7FD99B|nr:TetR/AcrR family transcriptional regulator [Intestinibacter sp.]MDY4575006.1 TetR/AcrR family transcriptional regulator [Intestinibacter sp.]
MENFKKEKKLDRRTKYTKDIIKKSLLKMVKKKPFEKITVTEICKMCEINRGTFYIHYCDLYDVLDDLLDEMFQETSSIFSHLDLINNKESKQCTYPLCKMIQENPKYSDLLLNDSLSNYIIDKMISLQKDEYISNLISLYKLSYTQAEAILIFQINGCLAINKHMYKNNEKWCEIQNTIDNFIKCGLKNYCELN